mmetsp:Transcript_3091/g.8981  ORF Transcript_3091/g.8981 Transcript_3091/m.8981 type:complete len:200 (+) Transcript_3091:495-1094(+)
MRGSARICTWVAACTMDVTGGSVPLSPVRSMRNAASTMIVLAVCRKRIPPINCIIPGQPVQVPTCVHQITPKMYHTYNMSATTLLTHQAGDAVKDAKRVNINSTSASAVCRHFKTAHRTGKCAACSRACTKSHHLRGRLQRSQSDQLRQRNAAQANITATPPVALKSVTHRMNHTEDGVPRTTCKSWSLLSAVGEEKNL